MNHDYFFPLGCLLGISPWAHVFGVYGLGMQVLGLIFMIIWVIKEVQT